ncbi:hypothetical protein K474DRAFT_660781 [Panus rudis PR-1116 ss-1]|nr:hypothetical protein K474DRAFT_660781 [Panus rudis PR-1116 ss-1]
MSSKAITGTTGSDLPPGAAVPLETAPAVKVSKKKEPYPFWLGGVAATIAASITHPLDLTKVRLQATGDKGMIQSLLTYILKESFIVTLSE